MPTVWDQIEQRAAAFHATHNAPKPAAIRTVYALGSLLAELDASTRQDVLTLLKEELLGLPCTA